jgi:hypothetical protein
MTVTPIVTPIPVFGPINTVTPFTYRDNDTFQTMLRGLRDKVNESIVQLALIDASLRSDLGAEILDLTNQLNAQLGVFNDLIMSVSDYGLAARLTVTESEIAAATTTVTTLATHVDTIVAAANVRIDTVNSGFNGNVAAWDKANNRYVYASKYLPGAASDLAALQLARDATIANHGCLIIDDIGRDWLIDNVLLFDTLTDFSLQMDGRIKRANTSVNLVPLITILNCTNFRAGVIRTNGNAQNNLYGGIPVDQAKHCVRIESSHGVKIQRTHSTDPAGDGVYIVGPTTNNVWIGHCESVSASATGRNTLSIVEGTDIVVDSIVCRGTGYITMPGGFDLEPNGSVSVTTSGTCGFNIFGGFTTAGVRQIQHVKVGTVHVNKTAGIPINSTDTIIRGVVDCVIASLTIIQDSASTHSALAFDDCDDVRVLDLDVPRSGKLGTIGALLNVSGLYIKGRFTSASSHCFQIYNLIDSELNLKLRCLAVGGLLIVKNATGVSSNVKFRGDWRKDATVGTGCMQVNGAVTDWVMEGIDTTGWVNNRFVGALCATGIKKVNCKGINNVSAIPSGNTLDVWAQGDIAWLDTPAAAATPGWVCVTGGAYGTFLWKPMASLGA